MCVLRTRDHLSDVPRGGRAVFWRSRFGRARHRRRAILYDGELQNQPAHAAPFKSARQHPPENQKENQAGHSSERTVEGQICMGETADLAPSR